MPARVRTRLIGTAANRPPNESLSITYINVLDIKKADQTLLQRKPSQMEHLLGSVKSFGFALPLAVDKDLNLIHGELLLEVAKTLGFDRVPTVCLPDLTRSQARALRIAFHKIESLSDWDEAALKSELEFISSVDFDLLSCIGFGSAELDFRLNTSAAEPTPANAEERLRPACTAVSVLGDIWTSQDGHRLGCLDALDADSYPALMGGNLAGLTFSDSPYNLRIASQVTRRPGTREFAMASGEMNAASFTTFLRTIFEHCAAHAREGSLSLQFMDWRHIDEMMAAGHAAYGELFHLAVWAKTNPGMGAPWRSAHELCFVWKKGDAPHVDNVQLGRHGRNRSNVWSYPGANQHRDPGSEGHATPKNLAMIQEAILDVSNRGDIVLDVCAGSATTLVAAHLARRRGYGMEIDPAYVDLGVRRLEARTKAPARHLDTGRTFAETAADRGVPLPSPARAR